MKLLTTSRHSLTGSKAQGLDTITTTGHAKTPDPIIIEKPSWKSGNDSNSPASSGIGSDLVRSSPPDNEAKSSNPPSSTSTFDRGSSRSPVTSSKASPTESQSSGSGTSVPPPGGMPAKPGRQRYDAVYYTREPISGAPNGEFEDKIMDVEINHRNTEV